MKVLEKCVDYAGFVARVLFVYLAIIVAQSSIGFTIANAVMYLPVALLFWALGDFISLRIIAKVPSARVELSRALSVWFLSTCLALLNLLSCILINGNEIEDFLKLECRFIVLNLTVLAFGTLLSVRRKPIEGWTYKTFREGFVKRSVLFITIMAVASSVFLIAKAV